MRQILEDFRDHPRSVGETYAQHWCTAMTFALSLAACALACVVHAFVPGLCKTTASRSLTGLYQRMVTHRQRRNQDRSQPLDEPPG